VGNYELTVPDVETQQVAPGYGDETGLELRHGDAARGRARWHLAAPADRQGGQDQRDRADRRPTRAPAWPRSAGIQQPPSPPPVRRWRRWAAPARA